jgi:hypothetical protein
MAIQHPAFVSTACFSVRFCGSCFCKTKELLMNKCPITVLSQRNKKADEEN